MILNKTIKQSYIHFLVEFKEENLVENIIWLEEIHLLENHCDLKHVTGSSHVQQIMA